MNEDIARALLELAETFERITIAATSDPEINANVLAIATSALYEVVVKYQDNTYEEDDREYVRFAVDTALTEIASYVVVAGTVVIAAPAVAGTTAVIVSSAAVGFLLSGWISSNRISLVPRVEDASQATQAVSILGYSTTGDYLISSSFNDTIQGFGGSDYIKNIGGSDKVFGGSGQDTIDYSQSESPVSIVYLQSSDADFQISHGNGTDTVTSVEHFTLTNGDDTVLISPDTPEGLFFEAGSGSDTLYLDTLDGDPPSGARVHLTAGEVTYGYGATQFGISGVENVYATRGDDTIFGSTADSLFVLETGDDTVTAGNGNDTVYADFSDEDSLDGGSGFDIFVDTGSASHITAQSLKNFEAVSLGEGADTIDTANPMIISGGGGDDLIRVSSGRSAPTIVWGGAGSDTIDIRTNAPENAAGILVVHADGLTAENFHLFDLEALDLGSTFDWSEIDVVLVNPDSQDKVLVNGQVLDVNQGPSFVLEDNVTLAIFDGDQGQVDALSAYTSAGYTIVSDEIVTPTEASPEGPIQSYREVHLLYSTTVANPDEYRTIQDPNGTSFSQVFSFKESFLKGAIQNSILAPAGGKPMIMLSEINGVMDTYGLDLGDEVATGPLVTVTDDYDTDWTIQQHWYFLPWQGYPGGYSSGEVTSFDTASVVFSKSEGLSDWFLVGGSISGTSIVGNNVITITMPDPDDETSGSNGGVQGGRYGNSSSGSNLTGGEGVSRVTGFNTGLNSIVIGGIALGAGSLPTGITASEVNGSTIITYGQDDHVLLRGVSLAAWQTGAAGQILGGLGDDALTGTAGNDVFAGGGGDDTIAAGAGDDHITYSSGDDVILGGLDNTGTDTLDLGRFAASDVRFAVSGDDVLITTTDGTIRLADQVLHEVGDTLSNIEAITFSDGTLSETDILVRAIADQQTIGDDVIQGTSWVDYINGSAGNDIITGGAGADEFWFADSFGNDEITDFEATDHIVFVGSQTISDFTDMLADHTTQVGSDVLIADGDGNTVLIKNFLMANLSETNFQFW